MAKRLLTAGLVAVGLTGFVMAGQWGYAAEPPAYPVPASPEMMQLVRDEHDLVADMIKAQLAAERDRYAEQRTAISATPSAVGVSFRTARPVFRAWPPKQLRRGSHDARNDDAAFPRRSPASPGLPELRPCPALRADRSGNARARGTPDLQLPGMQPLDDGISRRAFLVEYAQKLVTAFSQASSHLSNRGRSPLAPGVSFARPFALRRTTWRVAV